MYDRFYEQLYYDVLGVKNSGGVYCYVLTLNGHYTGHDL